MAQRKFTLRQRVARWAEDRVATMLMAGRLRKVPARDSFAYARLQNLGGWSFSDKRPLIKPTPANLRRFGKTPFARRAIKRIKDPIAALDWEVAPKQKRGGSGKDIEWNSELRRQAEIATNCLERPNQDDSLRTFLEQVIEDLCIAGGGVFEQQVGGDKGRPWFAWPVDVLSIQINPVWDGSNTMPRYFQTLGYGNVGGVQGIPFTNEEIVYIKEEPSTENPFGLGRLEVAFAAINRKLGVEEYAGKVASAAQPENLLVFPGMSTEELTTFRDWWRNDIEGQGQTPLVGGPADEKSAVQALKLRGAEDKALFIAYQELLIREIATSFCLSPLSLGVQNDVNRNTAEVVDDMDWDSAVVPVATNVSAYITRECINGRLGFSQLEFRFKGLKRDDKKAEAEIFKIEYESNAVTPNEYRARNNMPPAEGQWGDLNFVDAEIAKQAARGTGEIDDPDLPPPRASANPQGGSKGKSQEK